LNSLPRSVLLLGGPGFIGYHATRLLQSHGYAVTVMGLPPAPEPDLFSPETRVVLKDLNALADSEVLDLLRGHSAVVFAAGADDRVTPRRPAWPFFRAANVVAAQRFFTLARKAGVKRGVLLSSYFAHFARTRPELELAKHHPYIRSRLEQEQACLDATLPDLELTILELPYIFGAMPGRMPLWRPLVKYVTATPLLFYTRGGTNMIAVEHVAEAICGAIERGKAGERYLIGDENLVWVEFLDRLGRAIGRSKRVFTLPNWVVLPALAGVKLLHWLQGKEGGLDPVHLLELQSINTFFDPEPSRRELSFGSGSLDQAFAQTVEACRISR
jgi:nucleoside-diphosphate-sugar epimerase